ncbi:MAG TPA: PfkB family carbohydrate kinase [Polyangiaceae bacterium]
MNDVTIVGSVAFDDLEMPSGTFEDVLGGAATYASISASLMASPRLVGVVGNDFADEHLAMLKKRGIDCEGIERANGKTFRWRGRYSKDLASRETLDTQLNVFADFKPKLPAKYTESPFVLLGNIHPALQLDVLTQVKSKQPKLVAADTMNLWISTEPKLLGELISKIDLLIINDEEAKQLAGIDNLARAAGEIRRKFGAGRAEGHALRLIVKKGEHGALLFDDAGAFFAPAYPLEDVKDPTGAGDSFAGGVLGYLAKVGDASPIALRRAIFHGSALGSFCVEDIGTRRLAAVTKADYRARIDAFARFVDYGGDLWDKAGVD